MILTAYPSPQPKQHLDRFSRFCTDDDIECPYTLQWDARFPPILPLPMGDLDPRLIHGFLGPPESSTQMASRSVQPFFAELTIVTDHATRSVTIGRIYVRSTAMRPNNNNWFGCKSAGRLLSACTIDIYYYYSVRKLILSRCGQSPAAPLCKSPSAHRATTSSHHFRPSGIYCCRPDCLELAARLSPWSVA